MSTSLYEPMAAMPSGRSFAFCAAVKKVRKVLFEPADHAATQKFLDEELSKIRKREKEKWNFDFVAEEVADPEGVFEWRPATPPRALRPIRGLKRKAVEDYGGGELYAELEDVEVELVKPKAVRVEGKLQVHQAQSLITDFMPVKKKSSSSETKKKCEWGGERPSKKAQAQLQLQQRFIR